MATIRKHQQQSGALASPICAVVLVVSALRFFHTANAQQNYNDLAGYACNGQTNTCTTYATYRTQSNLETFASIGALFNLTAAEVAKDSGMTLTTTALASQTPLYISLACGCSNQTYYRSVDHKVVPNDTYSFISNTTYEGLTTWQAMYTLNNVPPTAIQINSTLQVPLRCACPTVSQANGGSTLLLTYVIYPQENLEAVASHFNVSVGAMQTANNVTSNTTLQPFTTLLVPLPTLPALSSVNFNSTGGSAPSSGPAPASSGAMGAMTAKLATVTAPLCVSIGVSVFGAMVFGF